MSSNTGPRPSRSRRGNALVLALVAVLGATTLGAGLLQFSLSVTQRQGHMADVKQAFYLAEAGLAEAYLGLSMSKTGNVGTAEEPAIYGDGAFWVEADDLGGNQVELTCTGMWGGGRVTLGMVVEPQDFFIAELGIFSADELRMNPDTLVDSFDSSAGSYGVQAAAGLNNDQAVLGSNHDIEVGTNSTILGDAFHGSASTLTLPDSSTISGLVGARTQPEVLPPVDVPVVTMQPGVLHSGALPLVIPPGTHGFEFLQVDSDSELVIQGPAKLVVDELYAEGRSHILFDTSGGPIDVYVTDSLDLKSGSAATTPTEQPLDVFVHVAAPAGHNVSFGASSEFYGFLYAPTSVVKVAADFEIFGGLVAKSFNLAAKSLFHQDIALARDASARMPTLRSWRVVDIPDAVASSGFGPFVTLGVDPAALPLPADAHEDQWLELTYVPQGGGTATYSGWESGFDWTSPQAVIAGTRDGMRFVATDPAPPSAPQAPPPPGTPQDWIGEASHASSDLTRWLVAVSPLTAGELNQAITRTPALDNGDLITLLDANQPLAAGTINTLLNSPTPLTSGQVKDEMIRNTPLANGDLNTVIDSPYLNDAQKREILILNSPLVGGVRNTLNSKDPPMNQADYDLIMAAQ